ncbi:MAG: YggS family pyridoxal phosphate enzyme [Elusimicrobia bacterium RIFCSPHIGHO2_02_FULL_57_9]|nr:MAG: YggS family pyridoxal phosphate enzyme [Elusimicrobia bacterium RIFCSPHIGHO2_02_FULL_57_9]
MSVILDNLKKIRYRIRAAAEKSRRDPADIELVAVTKYAGAHSVKELLESGLVKALGESRVQEALTKKQALGAGAAEAQWRLVGHLQTNKAKQAIQIFDAIDSLDNLKLAEVLERQLAQQNRKFPVLVQVKLSDKETQRGVAPEALGEFLQNLKICPHLDIQGLMTIAPELEPVETVRPYFRRLREIAADLFQKPAQLSMGMSRDFEVAVEEGATLVRVGRSLFS